MHFCFWGEKRWLDKRLQAELGMNLGYIEELQDIAWVFLTRNFILNRVNPFAAVFMGPCLVCYKNSASQTCCQRVINPLRIWQRERFPAIEDGQVWWPEAQRLESKSTREWMCWSVGTPSVNRSLKWKIDAAKTNILKFLVGSFFNLNCWLVVVYAWCMLSKYDVLYCICCCMYNYVFMFYLDCICLRFYSSIFWAAYWFTLRTCTYWTCACHELFFARKLCCNNHRNRKPTSLFVRAAGCVMCTHRKKETTQSTVGQASLPSKEIDYRKGRMKERMILVAGMYFRILLSLTS